MQFSDYIKNYEGQNPFSDSQARNFSDKKISSEFYPISTYWSLFNDQHEIILGTRGSGKTFLLKMMRYSMLKTISDNRANTLVKEKKYIGIYVPMHLEFVAPFNNNTFSVKDKVELFQLAFNCVLAEALIIELNSLLEEITDEMARIKKQILLASELEEIWFGEKSNICEFAELSNKVKQIYYNIDWNSCSYKSSPTVFRRQICSPLLAVKDVILRIMSFKEEPTWIVCIDEAEFLNETLQKCINSVFRSDSNRIALKVATLPFYHKTLETLQDDIVVSDGNDFCYKAVDLQDDHMDFIKLTNKLCSHRMKERFSEEVLCDSVEDFVGVVGNDDLIDYYREEVGKEKATYDIIEESIIDQFPPKRKSGAPKYSNKRKTIYDKYAPIFFLREMYKKSNRGNSKPGWFAGARMIRKASQGNPRMFIQIMSALFDCARRRRLTPKAQHGVLMAFSKNTCEATKALEIDGPIAYENLNNIAEILKKRVHEGYLVPSGAAFTIKCKNDEDFKKNIKWMQQAIAYSRLIVDFEVIKHGIDKTTRFSLSPVFAIKYWLPMRNEAYKEIQILNDINNSYMVRYDEKTINKDFHQMSLEDEYSDEI